MLKKELRLGTMFDAQKAIQQRKGNQLLRRLAKSLKKIAQRKRLSLVLIVAFTDFWIFLESFLLLKAVPYKVIKDDSIWIYRGVQRPDILHYLGVLFVLCGFLRRCSYNCYL